MKKEAGAGEEKGMKTVASHQKHLILKAKTNMMITGFIVVFDYWELN